MKNAKPCDVWAQCGKRRSDKSEENNRTTIIGYRENKRARHRVECKLLVSCGRSPINHVPCFREASWDTGQAEIRYMLVPCLVLYSHSGHIKRPAGFIFQRERAANVFIRHGSLKTVITKQEVRKWCCVHFLLYGLLFLQTITYYCDIIIIIIIIIINFL